MPGFFTDYANNKLLDFLLGSTPYSVPGILYIGLSQGSANKGGSVTEPTSGGYARVSVTNNAANFPPASGGSKSNAANITFPAPTAGWGAITCVFLADAATGGNVIAMADLASPKSIAAGNAAPTIAVGSLFLSHT